MARMLLQNRGFAVARRSLGGWFCAGLAALLWAGSPAAAAEYPIAPGQTVVGQVQRYVVRQGEVLADIARHFDVGYTELVAANPGVDPWLPGAGRTILIPSMHVLPDAPHHGIVINLAQWRLFYFSPSGDRMVTYPLGLGVIGRKTPLGVSSIVYKEPNPTWYPPPSIRAERPELPASIPPGPDNPLGAYALRTGWKSYLIHGTNKPDGVGRNVSHGCIRLYPEDIEQLFNAVGVGTPLRTVDQPATIGWTGDGLYVQVYPSKPQAEEIDIEQPVTPEPAADVDRVVSAAAGQYAGAVDWNAVRRAAHERSGMAVKVVDRSGYGAVAERREAPQPEYPGDRSAQDSYDPTRYSYERAPVYSYERLPQYSSDTAEQSSYSRGPRYSYDRMPSYPSYGEPQASSYGEPSYPVEGRPIENPYYRRSYSRPSDW